VLSKLISNFSLSLLLHTQERTTETQIYTCITFEDKFASKRKSNTPYRVVAEEIEVNPMLADNSANSSFDTWGAKVG
jgi:hypothetical protein